MSASNWDVCARCIKMAYRAEAEQLAEVMSSYGKIPANDFTAAKAAVTRVDPGNFRTFQEDYDVYGAGTGVVYIDYSGFCHVCELTLKFREVHRMDLG